MRPNPLSLETAKMLAEKLKVPIEQVMHMPPHILTQRLAAIAENTNTDSIKPPDKPQE